MLTASKGDNWLAPALNLVGLSHESVGRASADALLYLGDLAVRRAMGEEQVEKEEIPTFRSIMQQVIKRR